MKARQGTCLAYKNGDGFHLRFARGEAVRVCRRVYNPASHEFESAFLNLRPRHIFYRAHNPRSPQLLEACGSFRLYRHGVHP